MLIAASCPSPGRKLSRSPVSKPTLHRSVSTKALLAEDTPFAEHCRHYEEAYRVRGLSPCRVGDTPPLLPEVRP